MSAFLIYSIALQDTKTPDTVTKYTFDYPALLKSYQAQVIKEKYNLALEQIPFSSHQNFISNKDFMDFYGKDVINI